MSKMVIEQLQLAIEQNDVLKRELHAQQRMYIARDFGIFAQHVFIGVQPCDESPTHTHVYDLQADPRKVGCLYCKGQ